MKTFGLRPGRTFNTYREIQTHRRVAYPSAKFRSSASFVREVTRRRGWLVGTTPVQLFGWPMSCTLLLSILSDRVKWSSKKNEAPCRTAWIQQSACRPVVCG